MTKSEKILGFLKNEIVMVLSFLLAVISVFFVTPSEEYLEYIDFRTISLLFSLMVIMAGFNTLGIFKLLACKLLNFVKNTVQLVLTFVLLCFFSSMVITNDVALITFVPFTIITFNIAQMQHKIIYAIVLETVAANLGSMITPIGNPQNLYLVSSFNISIADFVKTIFPYALLSLVMLIITSLFSGKQDVKMNDRASAEEKPDLKLVILYCILFMCALLCVFRLIHFLILLGIVVTAVLIFNRKVFLKVDYSLLFTFVFLFVFIGNLGSIQRINAFLHDIVNGNEVLTGIVASQVISNVPAAILLSEFTDNISALIVGVNLGGLGTIIASMASLISFKFIGQEKISKTKYMLLFTVVNVIFLLFNLFLYFIIR